MKLVKVVKKTKKNDGVWGDIQKLLNEAWRHMETAASTLDKINNGMSKLANESEAFRYGEEIADSWIGDFRTSLKDLKEEVDKLEKKANQIG